MWSTSQQSSKGRSKAPGGGDTKMTWNSQVFPKIGGWASIYCNLAQRIFPFRVINQFMLQRLRIPGFLFCISWDRVSLCNVSLLQANMPITTVCPSLSMRSVDIWINASARCEAERISNSGVLESGDGGLGHFFSAFSLIRAKLPSSDA